MEVILSQRTLKGWSHGQNITDFTAVVNTVS